MEWGVKKKKLLFLTQYFTFFFIIENKFYDICIIYSIIYFKLTVKRLNRQFS